MHPERDGFIENKTGDPGQNHEKPENTSVSRREFLERLGIGLIALGLGTRNRLIEGTGGDGLKGEIETSPGENGEMEHPVVSVEFLYGAHRTARDTQKLQERIAEADVVVPESSGWERDELQAWRDLSEGTITPAQVFQKFGLSTANEEDRRWLEEYEIIYKSHKAIDVIDVPRGHPLDKEINDCLGTPIYFCDGDFEKALERVKNYTKNWADIQKKREAYMLSRFKEVVKERTLPNQKRGLNILITMGAVHTGVWHALKNEGVNTRAKFSPAPFIFSDQEELTRRYLFEKSVDDELVANVLLENILLNQFGWPPTEDTRKATLFFRKLISQFTVGEIKETFEKLKDKKFDERSKIWTERLGAKHAHWPRNEKEVDAFLNMKTPSE
jgi:hypothetical protein